MNAIRLQDAIGEIQDSFILEAHTPGKAEKMVGAFAGGGHSCTGADCLRANAL